MKRYWSPVPGCVGTGSPDLRLRAGVRQLGATDKGKWYLEYKAGAGGLRAMTGGAHALSLSLR